MNEIECLVRGCDFTVEHEEGWREMMEDHVRWIHVASRDFGPYPIPSLLALTINGVIRQDECMKFVNDVFERQGAEHARRMRRFDVDLSPFATVGLFSVMVALVLNTLIALASFHAIGFSESTSGVLRIVVSALLIVVVWSFFTSVRKILRALVAVRRTSYPDTTNDVDDDGGTESEHRESDRPPDA